MTQIETKEPDLCAPIVQSLDMGSQGRGGSFDKAAFS